jgi:hypothetical protein
VTGELDALNSGGGREPRNGEAGTTMTDIDPRSDIAISYLEDDLIVFIPLAGQITEMWRQRYQALAQAKGIRAEVYNHQGNALVQIAVPVRTEGEDVLKMLDSARALIAAADAVEQSPVTSNSPEAIVRQWWARQQT